MEQVDEIRAWQSRPLEDVYAVVYFDAIRAKVRDEGLVKNKAVYLGIGVTCAGRKEVPGLWIEQTEGVRFWFAVPRRPCISPWNSASSPLRRRWSIASPSTLPSSVPNRSRSPSNWPLTSMARPVWLVSALECPLPRFRRQVELLHEPSYAVGFIDRLRVDRYPWPFLTVDGQHDLPRMRVSLYAKCDGSFNERMAQCSSWPRVRNLRRHGLATSISLAGLPQPARSPCEAS